jgi:hypothetical protein
LKCATSINTLAQSDGSTNCSNWSSSTGTVILGLPMTSAPNNFNNGGLQSQCGGGLTNSLYCVQQ